MLLFLMQESPKQCFDRRPSLCIHRRRIPYFICLLAVLVILSKCEHFCSSCTHCIGYKVNKNNPNIGDLSMPNKGKRRFFFAFHTLTQFCLQSVLCKKLVFCITYLGRTLTLFCIYQKVKKNYFSVILNSQLLIVRCQF